MKHWSHCPLSWLGRNKLIKLLILPKLLYLFRVLLILIPAYFKWLIQNRVSRFVWGSSKPRIPSHTLFLPKSSSGLSFPNFAAYYKAAHIASLLKYHATQETPLWVMKKATECDPLSVSNLLWLHPKDHPGLRNPITKHFITLWDRFKFKHHLQSPSPSSPSLKTLRFTQHGSLLSH